VVLLNITLFKENVNENERDGNLTRMKRWKYTHI